MPRSTKVKAPPKKGGSAAAKTPAKKAGSAAAKTPAKKAGSAAPMTAPSRASSNGGRTSRSSREAQHAPAETGPKARFAEIVASKIEADIVAEGWPVGKVLGSESELIERFEVSRAVFREAVRIVEHHNVARMRRGPGGGLVVTEPDPTAVQNAMALYLRYAGVTRQELMEPRIALELQAVSAATERVDEEGIRRLREMLDIETERGPEAVTAGHTHDLHIVIAELTGNPTMVLFLTVLGKLNEEMVLGTDGSEYPLDLEEAASAYHRAHIAIVDAIAAGDVGLAQHRMRRHLEAIRAVPGQESEAG
jgi:DNA-binding FadR family transcriptional regulator